MTELTQAQRLALVVRAEVAMARADQAKEWAALVDRQTRPVLDAVERFKKLYGRRPDMQAPGDAATYGSLLAATGGSGVTREMLEAARAAADESAEALHLATLAWGALIDAWGESGARTHREWVGMDTETFGRAFAAALEEEGEVTQ